MVSHILQAWVPLSSQHSQRPVFQDKEYALKMLLLHTNSAPQIYISTSTVQWCLSNPWPVMPAIFQATYLLGVGQWQLMSFHLFLGESTQHGPSSPAFWQTSPAKGSLSCIHDMDLHGAVRGVLFPSHTWSARTHPQLIIKKVTDATHYIPRGVASHKGTTPSNRSDGAKEWWGECREGSVTFYKHWKIIRVSLFR